MTSFIPQTFEALREGFPPEIDHVSASQITQLTRCPEQYRVTRILGQKARPSAAQAWGSADHQAVAEHFARQLDTGEGLSVEDVQDAFVTYLDQKAQEEDIDWGDTKPGVVKDHGAILAGLYRRDVAPYVEASAVEVSFEFEHPLLPVRIDGRVDIETADALIERKTAGRKNGRPNPDWVVQGRIYQLAKPEHDVRWHQSIKSLTNVARQNVYGDDSAMTEPYNPERNTQTLQLVAQAIEQLKHYYTTYGPDSPWPGHGLTHPWACSYCSNVAHCVWQP